MNFMVGGYFLRMEINLHSFFFEIFFDRPVSIVSAENPNQKSDLEILEAIWADDKKTSKTFLKHQD